MDGVLRSAVNALEQGVTAMRETVDHSHARVITRSVFVF